MATSEPQSTLVAGMVSFNGLIPIFGATNAETGISEIQTGIMEIPSYVDWVSRLNATSYKTKGPSGPWAQEWWSVCNYLQYGGSCIIGATGSTGDYYSASGVLDVTNTPLHNKNLVNINVVFSGGSTSSSAAAASVANTRQDCLAFIGNYKSISSPSGYTGGSTSHLTDFGVTAGSEYVCFFLGRKQFLDTVSISPSKDLITTNMGADAAGCLSRVFRLGKPWYTIAGTTRGRILSVIKTEQTFDPTQIYGFAQANVNPIYRTSALDICVMGNKTGYTGSSTGLNRLDTMNMISYIKDLLDTELSEYLFTSNSVQTRLNILNTITPLLEVIKDSGSLSSYEVVCNETNNSTAIINSGQLIIDIKLKQTPIADAIIINFVLETDNG